MDDRLLGLLTALPDGRSATLTLRTGRRIALGRTDGRVRREYPELVYLCRGCARYLIGGAEVTVREGELLLLQDAHPRGYRSCAQTQHRSSNAIASRITG